MNDWNGQGEGHFKWREQQHAQVQKHEKLLFMCMLGNSLAERVVGFLYGYEPGKVRMTG